MTDNTKHTPTPWAYLRDDIMPGHGEHFAIVCRSDEPYSGAADIARTYNTDSRDNAEGNAAFIVRAVNSHAALVEALEKVKPIVGAACAASSNEIRPLREAAYKQLCAALALARGDV